LARVRALRGLDFRLNDIEHEVEEEQDANRHLRHTCFVHLGDSEPDALRQSKVEAPPVSAPALLLRFQYSFQPVVALLRCFGAEVVGSCVRLIYVSVSKLNCERGRTAGQGERNGPR
jgi:hypothetical protein